MPNDTPPPSPPATAHTPTFEESVAQLEQIVQQLQSLAAAIAPASSGAK